MSFLPVEKDMQQLFDEIAIPKVDLSSVLADIHISAFCLERYEPGLWWDLGESCLRLRHINVINWMACYGFTKMSDLPPAALLKFRNSLAERLERLEQSSTSNSTDTDESTQIQKVNG